MVQFPAIGYALDEFGDLPGQPSGTIASIRAHPARYIGVKAPQGLIRLVEGLLLNAAKHAISRTPKDVRVTYYGGQRITVSDRGPGIPNKPNRFSQANSIEWLLTQNIGSEKGELNLTSINALCEKLVITTINDGSEYNQFFYRGVPGRYFTRKALKGSRGTSIALQLDESIFGLGAFFDSRLISKMAASLFLSEKIGIPSKSALSFISSGSSHSLQEEEYRYSESNNVQLGILIDEVSRDVRDRLRALDLDSSGVSSIVDGIVCDVVRAYGPNLIPSYAFGEFRKSVTDIVVNQAASIHRSMESLLAQYEVLYDDNRATSLAEPHALKSAGVSAFTNAAGMDLTGAQLAEGREATRRALLPKLGEFEPWQGATSAGIDAIAFLRRNWLEPASARGVIVYRDDLERLGEGRLVRAVRARHDHLKKANQLTDQTRDLNALFPPATQRARDALTQCDAGSAEAEYYRKVLAGRDQVARHRDEKGSRPR